MSEQQFSGADSYVVISGVCLLFHCANSRASSLIRTSLSSTSPQPSVKSSSTTTSAFWDGVDPAFGASVVPMSPLGHQWLDVAPPHYTPSAPVRRVEPVVSPSSFAKKKKSQAAKKRRRTAVSSSTTAAAAARNRSGRRRTHVMPLVLPQQDSLASKYPRTVKQRLRECLERHNATFDLHHQVRTAVGRPALLNLSTYWYVAWHFVRDFVRRWPHVYLPRCMRHVQVLANAQRVYFAEFPQMRHERAVERRRRAQFQLPPVSRRRVPTTPTTASSPSSRPLPPPPPMPLSSSAVLSRSDSAVVVDRKASLSSEQQQQYVQPKQEQPSPLPLLVSSPATTTVLTSSAPEQRESTGNGAASSLCGHSDFFTESDFAPVGDGGNGGGDTMDELFRLFDDNLLASFDPGPDPLGQNADAGQLLPTGHHPLPLVPATTTTTTTAHVIEEAARRAARQEKRRRRREKRRQARERERAARDLFVTVCADSGIGFVVDACVRRRGLEQWPNTEKMEDETDDGDDSDVDEEQEEENARGLLDLQRRRFEVFWMFILAVAERSGEIFFKRSSLNGYLLELARAKDAFERRRLTANIFYAQVDVDAGQLPPPTTPSYDNNETDAAPVAMPMSELVESRDVRHAHSDLRAVFSALHEQVQQQRRRRRAPNDPQRK